MWFAGWRFERSVVEFRLDESSRRSRSHCRSDRHRPSGGRGHRREEKIILVVHRYYRIAADPHQLEREPALTGRLSNEDDLVRAARLIGLSARRPRHRLEAAPEHSDARDRAPQ
jgi:hypothetical protein